MPDSSDHRKVASKHLRLARDALDVARSHIEVIRSSEASALTKRIKAASAECDALIRATGDRSALHL